MNLMEEVFAPTPVTVWSFDANAQQPAVHTLIGNDLGHKRPDTAESNVRLNGYGHWV